MVPIGWLVVVALQSAGEGAEPAEVEAPPVEHPRPHRDDRVAPGAAALRAVAEAAGGTAGATVATVGGLVGEVLIISVPVSVLSFLTALLVMLIIMVLISALGGRVSDAEFGPLLAYVTLIIYAALMLLLSPLLALTAPAWDLGGYLAGVVLASSATRAGGLLHGLRGLNGTAARIAAHVGIAAAVAIPGLVLALWSLAGAVALMAAGVQPDVRARLPLFPAATPHAPDPVIIASLGLMVAGLGIGAVSALVVRPLAHGVAAFLLDAFAWPDREAR